MPTAIISLLDMEQLKPTGALDKCVMINDIYQIVKMPYSGLSISDKLIKNNRGLLKRYVRATVRGMAYLKVFGKETVAPFILLEIGILAGLMMFPGAVTWLLRLMQIR